MLCPNVLAQCNFLLSRKILPSPPHPISVAAFFNLEYRSYGYGWEFHSILPSFLHGGGVPGRGTVWVGAAVEVVVVVVVVVVLLLLLFIINSRIVSRTIAKL